MRIPKSILRIMSCAARESTRYAFNAVHFERKEGGRLSATTTDGRRLVQVNWNEDRVAALPGMEDAYKPVDKFRTFVPIASLSRIEKLIPADRKTPLNACFTIHEAETNGHVKMLAQAPEFATTMSAAACEGVFPNVAEVIPNHEIVAEKWGTDKPKRAARISLNGAFLAELVQSMVNAVPGENPTITIEVPLDASRPVKIERGKPDMDCYAIGVLMPVATE